MSLYGEYCADSKSNAGPPRLFPAVSGPPGAENLSTKTCSVLLLSGLVISTVSENIKDTADELSKPPVLIYALLFKDRSEACTISWVFLKLPIED